MTFNILIIAEAENELKSRCAESLMLDIKHDSVKLIRLYI